ncbi:MAG: carbohydrate ABC transporter permease [Halanaerobiaceae bacterium]
MKKLKQLFKLNMKQQYYIAGYVFCLPFIVGFLLFFLYPFLQAVYFSLSKLELLSEGFELHFSGIVNYYYIFFVHPNFITMFFDTLGQMLLDLPLILAFSFFSALILNQKFHGQSLARVIFFLPVIMAAGIILRMEEMDYITQAVQQGQQPEYFFSGAALRNLFLQARMPDVFIEFVLDAVERIPQIIRASGIQIIVFLAGLQSIPRSIYEAAEVEGATPWENFWLITLPMLSPLILTNIVYTIVDSFTAADNQLVQLIRSTAFGGAGFGVSMAMSILYFIAILLLLGIVFKLLSGWVFYHE